MDTSFAIHSDSKAKTGCILMVPGIPVFCSLKRRRSRSASKPPPTEAVLVALSDNLGLVKFHGANGKSIGGSPTDIPE